MRPEAREALTFIAGIASLQGEARPEEPLASLPRLLALVEDEAPEPMKRAARGLTEKGVREAMASYREGLEVEPLAGFFARVLLQPMMASAGGAAARAASGSCPRCGHPPQLGSLRPRGDGTDLFLLCSLCFQEWEFPRGRCSSCGEADEKAVRLHQAAEMPHLRVQTCESCRRYLHHIRLDLDPHAVPDVDEISGMALDVWARSRGYRKIVPNLVGI